NGPANCDAMIAGTRNALFARVTRLAAVALNAFAYREGLPVPRRRNVLFRDRLKRLEYAEVVVLSFRGPERDHRGERREAGQRALELGHQDGRIRAEREALARPAFHPGRGIEAALGRCKHEKLALIIGGMRRWKKYWRR